jgi:WD40 repeat protein
VIGFEKGEDNIADILLWNVREWRVANRRTLKLDEPSAGQIMLSSDARTLAVGVSAGVQLWDIQSGRKLSNKPLALPARGVDEVSFSPDGGTLAAGFGSLEGPARILLWDVSSRRRLIDVPIELGTGVVWSLAFSPDGKKLFAGLRPSASMALIWADNLRIQTNWLATIDLDPESWQRKACRIANRNLSLVEWRQFLGDKEYRRTFDNLPAGLGVVDHPP